VITPVNAGSNVQLTCQAITTGICAAAEHGPVWDQAASGWTSSPQFRPALREDQSAGFLPVGDAVETVPAFGTERTDGLTLANPRQ